MKKGAFIFSLCLPVFFIILGFPGCVKDDCKNTYSYRYYKPVYKTTDEVRANIKSNTPRETENPGKIYIRGNYIFLNEIDRGVHVIDNSNPSSPRHVSFIDIPGNGDIAVKGNTLYADLFTDLVAIDITDPQNVILKKVIENVFPDRAYGGGFINNTGMVVSDWEERDTTIIADCSEGDRIFANSPQVFYMSFDASAANNNNNGASPIGKGGSMARFTISKERLYTVSWSDLNVFNITAANDPSYTNRVQLDWGVETIFPFKNKLFIGTNSGMYVYSISNEDNPVQEGKFGHVRTCDPVIADDNYAYVTLRSGSTCQGFTNELDILALNNITDPVLKKVYQLSNPHGLSKDGSTLFICEGESGLKVYDASDIMNLRLLTTIEGINTYDVITYNKLALVVAKDGLYQYDYSNLANIRQLSKISVQQK